MVQWFNNFLRDCISATSAAIRCSLPHDACTSANTKLNLPSWKAADTRQNQLHQLVLNRSPANTPLWHSRTRRTSKSSAPLSFPLPVSASSQFRAADSPASMDAASSAARDVTKEIARSFASRIRPRRFWQLKRVTHQKFVTGMYKLSVPRELKRRGKLVPA